MGQRARTRELLVGDTLLAEPRLAGLLRRGMRSDGYLRIGTTLAERLVLEGGDEGDRRRHTGTFDRPGA